MIPIPPSRAIATAMLDSVTVSMFAEIIGIFRAIFGVSFVEVIASRLDLIFEYLGTSKTSSNVYPVLKFARSLPCVEETEEFSFELLKFTTFFVAKFCLYFGLAPRRGSPIGSSNLHRRDIEVSS